MLIFISGSLNAGKTTTARLLAKKLGTEFLDFDEIAHSLPKFDLNQDIPKVIQLGIEKINQLDGQGKSVVANYVLRQEDYDQLNAGLNFKEKYFFTLVPRIEIAQSNRGRVLDDWSMQRVKHHYETGIATPSFGKVIDNSDLTPEQTVSKIFDLLKK